MTKESRRLVGRLLCLDVRSSKQGRLGVSAPVRYGSAPERNRFKRLVREAYRKSFPFFPSLEMHIIPRQCAKKARLADIEHEIRTLLKLDFVHVWPEGLEGFSLEGVYSQRKGLKTPSFVNKSMSSADGRMFEGK